MSAERRQAERSDRGDWVAMALCVLALAAAVLIVANGGQS